MAKDKRAKDKRAKDKKRRPRKLSRREKAVYLAVLRERRACLRIAKRVESHYGGMGFRASTEAVKAASQVRRMISGRDKKSARQEARQVYLEARSIGSVFLEDLEEEE